MIRKMICINCPRGCELSVDTESKEVTGNFCPRGKTYGLTEITNPVRTITSTAKVLGGEIERVSVKTNKPIPKDLIFPIMEEINKLSLQAPVHIGTVLIENVLNTGSDVIATKSVGQKDE